MVLKLFTMQYAIMHDMCVCGPEKRLFKWRKKFNEVIATMLIPHDEYKVGSLLIAKGQTPIKLCLFSMFRACID